MPDWQKAVPFISHSDLLANIEYSPETGLFRWKIFRCNKQKRGWFSGCLQPHGYLTITLLYKKYYVHRLAWFYVTGEWPEDEIDHEDGNRSNTKFTNLRPANRPQQSGNTVLRSDNSSGAKGVDWNVPCQKWRARIHINGATKHIGLFASKEAAQIAYRKAAVKYFGAFVNTNSSWGQQNA